MTAQDLKNAILQLAVQGKLVPQDPNDEPASELLKRIKAEKEQLIKEGKIKKDKPLSELTADDLQFDIPETWAWTKLGYICQLLDGEKRNSQKYPYLEAKYLRGKAEATILTDGKFVSKGTRLILVDGENSGEVFSATEDGYMGSTFKMLFFPQELFAGYVLYFLQLKQSAFRNNKTGSAIPHLNKELFFNMPFPIPPLAEQQRIVAKIEELMPLVEEYGKAEERLTTLNAEFPDKLRKSILQQAIQGKLTERDPADEPASELLKRIRAEKERLIKEGKIKKEKPLPPISEEEMPFDIPDTWEWIRLSQVITGTDAGKSPQCEERPCNEKEYGVIKTTAIQNGFFLPNENKVLPLSFQIQENQFVHLGDLLITRAGPKNRTGIMCVVDSPVRNLILSDKTVRIAYMRGMVNPHYIVMALNSPGMYYYVTKSMTGMAESQVNISQSKMKEFILPLPPLAEQQRIVDRVNALLAVCDELR